MGAPQPGGTPLATDLDDGAGGGAGPAHLVEMAAPPLDNGGIRRKEGIAVDLRPVPIVARDAVRTDLDEGAADGDGGDHLAGDGAGGDAGGGLARRGTAAAAIVAQPVFRLVGEVGMAGAKLVADVGIVLRALVGVVDQERDRGAGGHRAGQALVDEGAGQDADAVILAALGGEARLAGAPAIEPGLDIGLGQRDAGRAAIDDAADGGPMALAEGGDPEEMAEAVVRHGRSVAVAGDRPDIRRARGFFIPTM